MDNGQISTLVKSAVHKLYTKDFSLIEKDLCERCLVHRVAVYLEAIFKYFNVDCEFNKSFYEDEVSKKILSNINGNYVDIIIHKRSNIPGENLLCFEIKKASNYYDRDKDRENLKILTQMGRFEYQLGFYIILGKTFEKTKMELYSEGNLITTLSCQA